jgi:hypothetical protein
MEMLDERRIDQDNRERAVFLLICDRPSITGPELSRSFTRLRKKELDRILVELIGRNLVRLEKGGLWQGLALKPLFRALVIGDAVPAPRFHSSLIPTWRASFWLALRTKR